MDSSGSGCGQVAGSCENGNEPKGISRLAERRSASHEGLSSMELVPYRSPTSRNEI
jgi:hypothetical protein